jgi:hypothetical protein
MPTLTDPRAEAFAQHRARGANLEDAYELAGFAGGQGHASRFARRAKVAARIGELIEAGRRQPITGQDIAFELQRMVQNFDEFDTPQRMRETRETLMELRKVQLELERERRHERERVERNSPPQARTSPKPPVSAWSLPSVERPAVPAPRRAALEFAASPPAMGPIGRSASPPTSVLASSARGGSARTPTVRMINPVSSASPSEPAGR